MENLDEKKIKPYVSIADVKKELKGFQDVEFIFVIPIGENKEDTIQKEVVTSKDYGGVTYE